MTESEQREADVQHVFERVCNCPPGMACRHRELMPRGALVRGFPSLSLMSKPITPALPRLRFFPGPPGQGKWRCRVELHDIVRRKGVAQLTVQDYGANRAEGWGNTKERAYRAWECKWRECMEKP